MYHLLGSSKTKSGATEQLHEASRLTHQCYSGQDREVSERPTRLANDWDNV